MTQPRYEFFRDITPVLGEPIPSSAEFCETNDEWWHSAHNRFEQDDFGYDWRVPVEVIPLDVAVEAIACNAEYHNNSESWVVDVGATRCYGGNLVVFHDSIAEALRKAAK